MSEKKEVNQTKKMWSQYLPEHLKQRLYRAHIQSGNPISSIIRTAIEEYLDRKKLL